LLKDHGRMLGLFVRRFLLPLLLASGCARAPELEDLTQEPVWPIRAEDLAHELGDTLRLCTYNIQDFTDGDGESYMRTSNVVQRHIASAADIVNAIKPDVLVIQEIENAVMLTRLNEMVAPPYPFGCITDFGEERGWVKRNIAALSRFPVRRALEIDFSLGDEQPAIPRGILALEIALDERHVLLVYAVHLKSNFGDPASNMAKRAGALEYIRDHVEQLTSTETNVVWEVAVIGDMNVDPDLERFAADTSLKAFEDWDDLWRGRPLEERVTIPTRAGDPALAFPAAAFDRIIVSPALAREPWVAGEAVSYQHGVDLENVFTRAGQSERHVSDHYPVYVDLRR